MSNWEIDIDTFVSAFEEQFEEVEAGSLKPDTEYRELPDWSSMQALMIIVFLDTDYGVNISAEELKTATSIQDLYDLVKVKATE